MVEAISNRRFEIFLRRARLRVLGVDRFAG
jgi:hypothetical protein